MDLPLVFCPLCGDWMGGRSQRNAPSLDHLVPRWMGGNNGDGNLWFICNSCNGAKGGKLPSDKEAAVFSLVSGFCTL